jgi:hypothetical protein
MNKLLTYGFINTLYASSLRLLMDKIKDMIIKVALINPALTDPLLTGNASSSISKRLKVRLCGDNPFII